MIRRVEEWAGTHLRSIYHLDDLGYLQGLCVEFYPGTANPMFISKYIDNLMDGRSFLLDPDGRISNITYFKDGLLHGFRKLYFQKINVKSVDSYYEYDLLEGERIEVREDF